MELETKYHGILLFTDELKQKWEKKLKTRKLIKTIPHPYVLYQRRTKYKLGLNRRGSLFFFSHSTWDTEIETKYELLKARLDALDEDFKPVRIVLHFIDVLKGKDLQFKKMGYKVISFGNMYNTIFVDNLYGALKNTRYALSNTVGSHAFYCINVGIPFSLVDTETTLKQPEREINYNKQARRHLKKVEEMKNLIGTSLNYKNSPMTIDFVNNELGLNNTSLKLPLIYFILRSNIIYTIAKIKTKINRFFFKR